MLAAAISVQGSVITVATTHLSLHAPARMAAVPAVLEFLAAVGEGPVFLTGDMNAEPHSLDMQVLRSMVSLPCPEAHGCRRWSRLADAWSLWHEDSPGGQAGAWVRANEYTFPNDDPSKRIDMWLMCDSPAVFVDLPPPCAATLCSLQAPLATVCVNPESLQCQAGVKAVVNHAGHLLPPAWLHSPRLAALLAERSALQGACPQSTAVDNTACLQVKVPLGTPLNVTSFRAVGGDASPETAHLHGNGQGMVGPESPLYASDHKAVELGVVVG